MPAAAVDFDLVDNEDFVSPEITIYNADDTKRDLTGVDLRMQVRPCKGSPGSPLVEFSIDNGGVVVLDAVNGVIQITIARFSIRPAGAYWQDLIEDDADFRTALFSGRFNYQSGVTRWT